DLALDPLVEIASLSAVEEATRNELLSAYGRRLRETAAAHDLEALYLDLRRLGKEWRQQLGSILAGWPVVQPLEPQETAGPWRTQTTSEGEQLALLELPGPDAWALLPA